MEDKEIIIAEILAQANVHPLKVKGMYIFGSRVYGTVGPNSDYDIILIANASAPDVEVKGEKYNIHIIVPDLWDKLLRDNHIKAIECVFAPEWAQLIPYSSLYDFVYKEESFRHNISHTVSNSWVKCKKKLEHGEYYIGIKSMFHALRIAEFGIQFAVTKHIQFDSANWIWDQLKSKEWTWEELETKYKMYRNQQLSEFRKAANKKLTKI
jgi:predicted nucleotidyltransferase